MRALFLCVLYLSLPGSIQASEIFGHDAFDRVLRQFVDDQGLVNYRALKADPQDLNAYVAQIGKYSPENAPHMFPSQEARLAYWLNTYNALAIDSVVGAYPVKSVRDIKWFYGFFNRTKHLVGGKKYTLKHIEHEIVRKRFPDPRIHVGLNCASMGCPILPQRAFVSQTLDTELEKYMIVFVRDPRHVNISRAHGKLYLSEILNEFEEDFTSWYKMKYGVQKATIIDYIKLYLPNSDAGYLTSRSELKIEYLDYDWRLNDQEMAR